MGRGGKLDINIDKVRLADGEKVLLRAVKGGKGGGHQGAMVGAMVATSLVIWPAVPLFLFMHGKDITIPKGTQITAFVEGDAVLDPAKFTSEALNPKVVPQPAPVATATPENSSVSGQTTDVTPQQESLGNNARKLNEQKATATTPLQ